MSIYLPDSKWDKSEQFLLALHVTENILSMLVSLVIIVCFFSSMSADSLQRDFRFDYTDRRESALSIISMDCGFWWTEWKTQDLCIVVYRKSPYCNDLCNYSKWAGCLNVLRLFGMVLIQYIGCVYMRLCLCVLVCVAVTIASSDGLCYVYKAH